MQLKRLVFSNILSWKRFSQNFSQKNTVMFAGKTGAGKSAVFEAICLGLWGKSLRGSYKSFVKTGTKKAEVCLLLEDDSRWLQISREFSATGTTKAELIFAQRTEKDRITLSGVKPVNDFIEHLFHLNFDSFMLGHYFSQTNNQCFLELTDAQQKNVLTQFINVKQFTELKKKITISLSQEEDKKLQLLQQTERVQVAEEQQQQREELKEDSTTLEKEKHLCEKHLKNVTTKSDEIYEKLTHLNKQQHLLLDKEAQFEKDIVQWEKELSGIKANKKCVYCHSSLSVETQQTLLLVLQKKIQTHTTQFQEIQKQRQTGAEAQQNLRNLIQELEKTDKKLSHKLTEIKTKLALLSKIKTPTTKQLQADKQKLAEKLRLCKEKKEYLTIWKSEFGAKGFTVFLLEQLLPYLTNQTNHYLSQLIPAIVVFEIESETGVLQAHLESTTIGSLASKGQGRLLHIAMHLAFHDLILSQATVPLQLMLFDEASDHLDPNYAEDVAILLKKQAEQQTQTLLISHDSTFIQFFQTKYDVWLREQESTLHITN